MNETLIQLDEGASIPTRAHADDVGYDVKAVHVSYQDRYGSEVTDPQTFIRKIKIDTGLHLCPPAGYHFEVVPNSRLAKSVFCMPNSIGLIDPGYTGSVKVILSALWACTLAEAKAAISKGTVCGQLVLRKTLSTTFKQVETLPATERGNGGFGSTQKGAES